MVDEGALTDEQEELIGNVLPLDRMRTLYTPYSANALKFSPEFNDEYLESHKVEFLLTWAALFPDNMGSYVRAICCRGTPTLSAK